MVGFSIYSFSNYKFFQDIPYEDENLHALPHEQYFATHRFSDIFPWVFNKP